MASARTTTRLPTTGGGNVTPAPDISDGYITYMVVPPDGGWGWVVMVAAFFSNVVEGAVIYSIGSYSVPFTKEFSANSSAIALVGSLLQGFHQLVGPIVSALSNHWGFRTVTILGGIVASAGFSFSYFATSIEVLYLTMGVIGGIGVCLFYVPGAVIVSFYFVRWRALAVCLSLCGAGVGGAIFPIVLDKVIDLYGWRVGTLCEGALVLICILLGLTFRPIKPTPMYVNDAGHAVVASGTLRQASFVTNSRFPTASEHYSVSNMGGGANASYSSISVMTVPMEYYDNPIRDAGSEHIVVTYRTRRRAWYHRIRAYFRKLLCYGCKARHVGVRPLYRDDIFYGGSIKSLRSRVSHLSVGTGHEYTMTVTRLPTLKDIEQERSSKCFFCPEAFTRILATMMDVSLLRSPSFLMLALSGCLLQAVSLIPFIYVKERATAYGVDEDVVPYLLTSISVSNTLSRIVFGVVTSLPRVSVVAVTTASLVAGGVAILVTSFTPLASVQITCYVLFGSTLACFFSLRSVVIVELLGLEKLTNAFGLLLLFQGIASVAGPPIAGTLQDVLESNDAPFYFTGTCLLLSALVTALLPWVNRRERARKAKKAPTPAMTRR